MLPPLRNPYAGPVDYAELAQQVPALSPFLRPSRDGRQTIDFRDDKAIRALNAALLQRDFALSLDLPEDRLCPAVPSRLEYVLFVLQLALLTSDKPANSTPPSLVGLDIGTGASAIYPLLAVRTLEPSSEASSSRNTYPSSSSFVTMLATDIDAHSLEYARRNVTQTGLSGRISVFEAEPEGALFPQKVLDSFDSIDFMMCNPPFYSSQDEIDATLAAKELEPFAKCTGAENEMVTPGGEVAFVSRMVEESHKLGKDKIRWFTSLLGKHSSIGPLVELLKAKQILNYHVHALPPHGHTVRWVLSWSLQDRRFPAELLEATSSIPSQGSASSSTLRFPLGRFASPAVSSSSYYTPLQRSHAEEIAVCRAREALEEVLRELCTANAGAQEGANGAGDDGRAAKRRRVSGGGSHLTPSALEWRWDEPPVAECERTQELFVRAWRNVWSRKARRGGPASTALDVAEPARPLLELRVRFERAGPHAHLEGEPDPPQQVKLTARWVRGRDADCAAFTGLWGFVTRKVGEKLKARGGEADTAPEQEKGNGNADWLKRL
ncbi:hypothetical protein JCM3770_006703 [Rhodotorula araucariae]